MGHVGGAGRGQEAWKEASVQAEAEAWWGKGRWWHCSGEARRRDKIEEHMHTTELGEDEPSQNVGARYRYNEAVAMRVAVYAASSQVGSVFNRRVRQ